MFFYVKKECGISVYILKGEEGNLINKVVNVIYFFKEIIFQNRLCYILLSYKFIKFGGDEEIDV